MIVVTVGTNEQPFDRLVRAAGELRVDGRLLIQHGASTVALDRGEPVGFLTFDELEAHVRVADAVICHAGVGSVMLARRHGHRPIVMPRRVHLGEAVDDHQLPLARRLAADGLVTLVEEAEELAGALRDRGQVAVAATGSDLPGASALAADVRGFLAGLATIRPRGERS